MNCLDEIHYFTSMQPKNTHTHTQYQFHSLMNIRYIFVALERKVLRVFDGWFAQTRERLHLKCAFMLFFFFIAVVSLHFTYGKKMLLIFVKCDALKYMMVYQMDGKTANFQDFIYNWLKNNHDKSIAALLFLSFSR